MSKFFPLKQALENNGWAVTQVPLASDCWWAKEIWQLTSLWRPNGRTIYLTLLLDPLDEFDKNCPPDSSIWAVKLSSTPPRLQPGGEIPVQNKLKSRIDETVALAASMRLEK